MAVKAQEHGRLCQRDVCIRQWVLEEIAAVRRVIQKVRGKIRLYPANGSRQMTKQMIRTLGERKDKIRSSSAIR